jgi:hypothetical protein
MLTRTIFGALMVSITCPAWADITGFTSKSEFEAAIKPGYLFENFDNLAYGGLWAPSMRLEQQGFVATITASRDDLFSGSGNMSTNVSDAAIVITFSGEAVTAVGARFFPTDINGFCRDGKMVITLDNGEPPIELETSDCTEFFGFTTEGSAIAEIRIQADRSEHPDNWPTVDDLYIGRRSEDAPHVLTVAVDIKPGDFPNVINPKSKGVIPVAILTTDSFDASTVNSATVTFGATGGEAPALKATMAELNMDGRPDMVLYFRTEQVGIRCGDTLLKLMGLTQKGEPLSGTDSIRTVSCK